MPVFLLFLYIVITALLAALAIWILSKLKADHPPLIDNIIWVVAVIIIVFMVLQAFGLLGAGPIVPRLR